MDKQKLANISWEGDSLERLKKFPSDIKKDFGFELHLLQSGEKPLSSRPMKSIGSRVYELKDRDEKTWYRVVYLAKVGDMIYVLHSFTKDTRKTEKKDLDLAKERLKKVKQRLAEEKNDGKRKKKK